LEVIPFRPRGEDEEEKNPKEGKRLDGLPGEKGGAGTEERKMGTVPASTMMENPELITTPLLRPVREANKSGAARRRGRERKSSSRKTCGVLLG
jgi:hypothetical protein